MYKYSDILFCLREEYLKNEEILKKLENYISVKKDNREVKFHLELDNNKENIELYYEVLKKKRFLSSIISKMVGLDLTAERGKMAVNNNGIYQPNSQAFAVKPDNNESFMLANEELFSRPFLDDFYNIDIDHSEDLANVGRSFRLTPDRIFTCRRNDDKFVTSVYDSIKDEVKFSNNKGRVSYDDMYDILDSEFTIDGFSRDMQKLIEGKDIYGLKCCVYDTDDNKKEKTFEPIIEDKRLVLVRK